MVNVGESSFVNFWNVAGDVSLISLEAHGNFGTHTNLRQFFSWPYSCITRNWLAGAKLLSLLKIDWIKRLLKLVLSANCWVETRFSCLVLLKILMENALVLGDWVIKGVWLVNMTSTLRQTHLCCLHSRSRDLRVVFLVSDVVNARCRDRVLSVCWLSWRLAIEAKQVSEIFSELSSARDTSISHGCACSFDWCCRATRRLFWQSLVR